MKIGFVGLGKMGFAMVSSLSKKHSIVATDVNRLAVQKISKKATAAYSISEMVSKLPKQKIIWVMVPHGKITNHVLKELCKQLSRGDIVIDGGNSYFEDSIKHGKMLSKMGIKFIDCGVSGGVSGALNGASLMAGGDKATYNKIVPLLKTLAVPNGYGYMGESGAGHFVKMVHNGIEYSLLQSYAEGYELIHKSSFQSDLKEVTKVWQHGSVIRSWLVDLMADYLKKNPRFKGDSGIIGGGSTGTWTQKTGRKLKVKTSMLDVALRERKLSHKKPRFAHKIVAALRLGFGGHKIPKK